MSTADTSIEVPPPAEIRRQLAAAVAEARALRQLLKLAEAAVRAREAQRLREATEGGRDDA
jgi:hypothetical protein